MQSNIGLRARQLFFSVVMGLLPNTQQKIFGFGKLLAVGNLFEHQDFSKVLLVTTPGMVKRGVLDRLLSDLTQRKIEAHIFDEVMPDPTDECAMACAQRYNKGGCQAIVAIGGGSVIDCAKIAGALVVNPGKSVTDISGSMRVAKHLPYFIAVPTTAGTGSEVTAGAVITNAQEHFKHPVNDPHLVPDVAILDPQLTLGMPAKLTAYTGIDALSHAVEAYTNRFSQQKTRHAARQAIQTIFANLPQAYENGLDIQARAALLEASYDAGYAITHNYVGYIHAISHAIGALYELPHGYINAILMPHVLRAYGSAVDISLAELAQCAGVSKTGASDKDNATAFITALEKLTVQFGIPHVLEELSKKDFELIAQRALAEGNPTYPVPVIWNKQDVIGVLEAVACG
ncbi:iron-containing alcohol dehydrogenase [Atopobium fossor]|uniref:iron-containing alcohol dehydrogenase n=1 Tax=Atopobium fossor TaxID=39487 RepID=UPI00041199B4|nr:iron-containing alcohol dehydrogenase [Atopobium fossor]